MKFSALFPVVLVLAAGALLPGCAYIKHVPPGQSLSAAMAKKAELVQLPAPPPQTVAVSDPAAGAVPPGALPGRANPAPALPDPQTEKVADAYDLGNLCLQQGRYADAITAYQAALKEDPTFAEAWNNLAIAYQNSGQSDKAMEAFKKYKMVALH